MSVQVEMIKRAFELRRAGSAPERAITCHYLNAWYAHREDPPLLREAHGCAALLDQSELQLCPDERVPGLLLAREPVGFNYGSGTWVDETLVARYAEQERLTGEALDAYRAKVEAVREARYWHDAMKQFNGAQTASIKANAANSTWFGGHMVIDYETILAQGFVGYEADIRAFRAQNGDPERFYEAMEVQLRAVQRYFARYAQLARACALLPEYDRADFEALAEDMAHLIRYAPQTFRQGLLLVWSLHMLNGCDSFGRFDHYLGELFARDRASGALSYDDAEALVAHVFVKVEETKAIQNMTIGGVNADGSDHYTELTAICIDVTRQLTYKGPNLCLRVTPGMPAEIWQKALDCLGTGIGLPALYNDPLYVANFARTGVPETVARGYCLAGCSQVMLPGMCNFINDIGMFNAAKVFELTLRDGFDPYTNAQVGPHTGRAQDFTGFDDLMNAFYAQLDYFCEIEAQINDLDTLHRRATEGYTMRTLFMRDCLQNGKAIYHGGARYNHIELEVIGLTNAADSLYALKKAVYDDRRVSMADMMAALDADFAGAEPLRLYLRNQIDKFGNDCAEVDALRAQITARTFGNFNGRASVIGGFYVPGEVIFTAHEHTGYSVGATPDGRRAHAVLADSAGACQGLDREGPTALLSSVLRIPCDYLLTTVVLNVRFMANLYNQPGARERVQRMFTAFFERGGMQLQVNVCDAELLRRALEDPEPYRSLVVRVGGYSDYFVNLSPALQRELVERTEHAV